MKYHEIGPIEKAVDKLHNELQEIASDNPTMYEKSRLRYRKIAEKLLECANLVSSIIATESLSPHSDDEFNELSSVIDELKLPDKVKQVSSNIQYAESIESKLPRVGSNKYIISRYASVISQMSSHPCNCIEAFNCMQLINRWFQVRFIQHTRGFVYNIHQLPIWISTIIILYGQYLESNSVDDLYKLFEEWEVTVVSGQNKRWAIPQEVYQLIKNPRSQQYTLSAVMINDLLFNHGFTQLTCYDDPSLGVFMDSDYVVGIVKTNNSALAAKVRVHLTKADELMKECHLTFLEAK